MEVSEEELKNMSPEQIAELQKQNCIFCQLGSGKVPAKTVYEDEDLFAVLDINPATPGHVLLMPKEHYAIMPQVPEYIIEKMFMAAKGLSQGMLKALSAKGTTIFVANGMVAGQRAPHVMVHIIPRVEGDGIGLVVPRGSIPDEQIKVIKERLGPLVKQHIGESTVKPPQLPQEPTPEPQHIPPPEAVPQTTPDLESEPEEPEQEEPESEGKVAKVGVKKDKDFLYYVDKDGDIARKKLVRGKKKKDDVKDVDELIKEPEKPEPKQEQPEPKEPQPEKPKSKDKKTSTGLEDLANG